MRSVFLNVPPILKTLRSFKNNALLRKAFTDILNCCDIHFTYILLHMANLLNVKEITSFWK